MPWGVWTVCRFKERGLGKNEEDGVFEEGGWYPNAHYEACHQLREKDRKIVKLVNSKDCTNTDRVKMDLKNLDPSKLSFQEKLKHSSKKMYAPITEAFGVNVRRLG